MKLSCCWPDVTRSAPSPASWPLKGHEALLAREKLRRKEGGGGKAERAQRRKVTCPRMLRQWREPGQPLLITMLALRGETPLSPNLSSVALSIAILCVPLLINPVPGNLHPSPDLSCLYHPHKQIFQQMLIQRISQQLHGLMVIKKDQN